MRVGVVFPQTELPASPEEVRAFAVGAEELGYTHLLAYEHVLGADPAVHPGWDGPYDLSHHFHEPFVLFGFLAGLTNLEFLTGVLVLPQRQTALVAKQAAALDVLSGGRLRLGVGLGWNRVEYEALGKTFGDRGRRLEEQIELLRALFTETSVTFVGRYETVTGAGLSPLPLQRPIPVWIGAGARPAIERAGRLADGWIPQRQLGADLDEGLAILRHAAEEAGRDPASIAMEGRISLHAVGEENLAGAVEGWRAAGATHLAINTMRLGLTTAGDHLALLAKLAPALGV